MILQALRVSMEEQRVRQEAEQRQPVPSGATSSPMDTTTTANVGGGGPAAGSSVFANVAEESASGPSTHQNADVNLGAMTEEEQLAYAMQMSLHELDEHSKSV